MEYHPKFLCVNGHGFNRPLWVGKGRRCPQCCTDNIELYLWADEFSIVSYETEDEFLELGMEEVLSLQYPVAVYSMIAWTQRQCGLIPIHLTRSNIAPYPKMKEFLVNYMLDGSWYSRRTLIDELCNRFVVCDATANQVIKWFFVNKGLERRRWNSGDCGGRRTSMYYRMNPGCVSNTRGGQCQRIDGNLY